MISVANLKDRVRARDHFRCVDCGMSEAEHYAKYGRTVEVHRLTPGSEYTMEGCVTVCQKCHRERHRKLRGNKPPRSGKQFSLWLDTDLSKDLHAFMASTASLEYPTQYKTLFAMALRAFLDSKGFKRPPPK